MSVGSLNIITDGLVFYIDAGNAPLNLGICNA